MIAANLYADLTSRGVLLAIERGNKLRVRSPEPLSESLALAIVDHKADLLQFLFELEECAAILEYEQGNDKETAERLARECVRFGTATPDGELWMRERAQREFDRLGLSKFLQIVSVERLQEA